MALLSNKYTIVKEEIYEDLIGNRIRYGTVNQTIKQNNYAFKVVNPNELIVMQRWSGKTYGTTKWLLYIFKTKTTICSSVNIPNVYPKVDLLLFCSGTTRVKRTLALIHDLQQKRIELNAISNNYWINQNARLQTGRQLILPTDTDIH